MNYNNFKYISSPTSSSLSRGYIYTADELNYLVSASVNNFPFGSSENDAVEVSIMSVDGTELSSYSVTSSLNYTPYTQSFIDVNNRGVTYSCSIFNGDFVVVGTQTRSLFLDIAQTFNAAELTQGTYLLGLNPVRYVVGSPYDVTRSLVVREISPSGTEISVSPSTTPFDVDPKNIQFNIDYNSFRRDEILVKNSITPILTGIENPAIYNAYYKAYATHSASVESAKQLYAFLGDIDWNSAVSGSRSKNIGQVDRGRSDMAVIQFIIDIYYGVKRGSLRSNGRVSNRDIYGIYDQYKNTLFQNYASTTTFAELRNFYYSLFVYILDRELKQITSVVPENYAEITAFFQSVLYDIIFSPIVDKLETEFGNLYSGYLKNYACFSDRTELPILNYSTSNRQDSSGNGLLLMKFAASVPTNIKVGSTLWITNRMVTDTIIQSVYLYANSIINTVQLRGPNFLIGTEAIGNGTANSSLESIIGVTGSLYDEIVVKLAEKQSASVPLNTDYRSFENFIKFSSADVRLDIYTSKMEQIQNCQSQLTELSAKLLINPVDDQYLKDQTDINTQLDLIETSMDGYENFLYNNPSWYAEHTALYNGVSSASLYDRDNVASLQNTIPNYLRENLDNSEYVTFINMVGHYFDNLSLYITQFTQKNDPTSDPTTGISGDVVYSMLSSLGWEPEIGKENLPLLLSTFSKSDFDVSSSLWNSVGTMSETERSQIIWKRILNNLPYILKTKGTSAAISALANCYGIPQNLLTIKEYGGIESSYFTEQDSVYSFDETKYAISFTGANEYLNAAWTGSAQSLEFSVSFDPTKTSEDGQVFRIVNCSDSWIVGFYRERGLDWGRVFFTIRDNSGNSLTTMTPRAPIFSGDTFTVLLRKNDLGSDFLLSPYYSDALVDLYPRTYDLYAIKSDESRVTFAVSSSILLSGSYNSQWKTGSQIFFGNYAQDTSSFGIDPEAFFGTLDEIKIWEIPIDNKRLENHATYQGAYDSNNPLDVVDSSLLRISVGFPIDLHTGSGVSLINNLAFRTDYNGISAVSFPPSSASVEYDAECDITNYVSGYPFQFKPYNLTQHTTLPNFGSNKFRSNKINYVTPVLVSSLSSDTRSSLQSSATSTVDSNKLGVFFSPMDSINSEIIKFFGKFEFGDLIGNPQDVYKKIYPNFEQFRKLYFDQGGGQLDYQTFINMIRSYFDKSMFKYVQNLVPARAKIISGILIEPSILERPKIQQKPVQREIHRNVSTTIGIENNHPVGTMLPRLTQSLHVDSHGTSTRTDYNQVFYNDRLDTNGFGIYADNGIAYYKDDFWRVDIIPVTKKLMVESKNRIPLSQTTEFDAVNTNRGQYQIISQSYEAVNISRFPILSQYPVTNTLVLSTIDDGDQSQRTEFTAFTGSVIFSYNAKPSSGHLNSTYCSEAVGDYITINGAMVSENILSSSLYGTVIDDIGISGKVHYPYTIQLNGDYDRVSDAFVGSIILSTGTSMPASLYSLTANESIFDVFRSNARGPLFKHIDNISYSYRRDLSLQNIPFGSRPLDGYYFTHYRYKKPMFSRKVVNMVDSTGTFAGTFTKGLQTQKTTVQLNGLLDNSPPVIITKSA